MEYYFSVWKKYAEFVGRASRAEYWYFTLFNLIAFLGILVVDLAIGDKFLILSTIYDLAVLIPSFAVSIRRLHDIDKSGWWWLVGLIPLLGTIWLTILLILDGTQGENKYGPNPKT